MLEKRGRDRLHIMAEVLAVTINGALKTQIMYKANLSFVQLNEYLSFLLEVGLIKTVKKGEKKFYKTTRKGIKYLESYDQIRGIMTHSGEYGKYKPENKLIKIKSEIRVLKKTVDGLETTIMSSIECPHCQESIFPDYPFCPYCGKKLQVSHNRAQLAQAMPRAKRIRAKE